MRWIACSRASEDDFGRVLFAFWRSRLFGTSGNSGALSEAVRAVAFGRFDTCEKSLAFAVVADLSSRRKDAVKLVWAPDLGEYRLFYLIKTFCIRILRNYKNYT